MKTFCKLRKETGLHRNRKRVFTNAAKFCNREGPHDDAPATPAIEIATDGGAVLVVGALPDLWVEEDTMPVNSLQVSVAVHVLGERSLPLKLVERNDLIDATRAAVGAVHRVLVVLM